MSFNALLYTAAAIAFFVLMVMRPAVDMANTADNPPATDTEQSSEQNAEQVNNSSGSAATPVEQTQTEQTNSSSPATTTQANNNAAPATTQAEQAGNDQAGTTPAVTASNNQAETTPAVTASNNQVGTTPAVAASKPDYAREKRIRNQISDAILEGDVLFLHDETRNFMAIQTTAENARGGAVILHGRGFHPNWEDTVYPLRTGLVEEGWTTLSLQMPVLEKQAKYYDYVPLFPEAGKRISAGIQHLKDQGISPIVLIAHSCGGHMAMQWVRDNGDSNIAAFAGLGMGATDAEQFMSQPFPLDKMQVPVLDVYGENDFPAVIKMAPERWELVKTAGNPQSEQRVVPEADHYFKDQGDELVSLVATWLNGLRF